MASAIPDRHKVGEPEEVMVADARAGVSPAQMVEQKVLTLLGSRYKGALGRGTGRAGDRQGLNGG